MNIETTKKIFDAHDGVMKKKELLDNKIYPNYLANLVKQGYVERVRHGYYQWQDERAFNEVTIIAKLFPDAVLCRYSALQYYGYTDRTPHAWYLAVDRGYTRSKFNLDYPTVKPVYCGSEKMAIGVETVEIEDTKLKIFDRERVICDCLKHENKMDAEIFNKAIQAYVKDPEKDIARLMKYAKLFSAEKKVRRTIGVWL